MEKKHPCPDCYQCQWCSDDRCRLCLKTGCGKKLSMAEQIALYERLNADDESAGSGK
jgi:hypothetical protein